MADLDELALLEAWLLKRSQPDSGIQYESRDAFTEDACTILQGPDATFVAKHFHGAGAAALAAAIASLREERDEARQIVRDIHWMAVRYADGRKSYAPGMLNDALRKAYDAGWLTYRNDITPQHDLDPQYARDGDKPEYCSIEDRALAAETRGAVLMEALNRSSVALNDWVATYASDHCDAATVEAAWNRIRPHGTLGYIANVLEGNRIALASEPPAREALSPTQKPGNGE
jgi:hypothetical protein